MLLILKLRSFLFLFLSVTMENFPKCNVYVIVTTFIYVTGSAKRYTNAQAMIFLYKRCYSKTRNIFYSLKKIIFGA